ncbi:MAG: hypothetical protein JWM41_2931 [Gemmatimonadetes bacterium]|nr:hypothetical protein [Gemmatimonadota bacterium]
MNQQHPYSVALADRAEQADVGVAEDPEENEERVPSEAVGDWRVVELFEPATRPATTSDEDRRDTESMFV